MRRLCRRWQGCLSGRFPYCHLFSLYIHHNFPKKYCAASLQECVFKCLPFLFCLVRQKRRLPLHVYMSSSLFSLGFSNVPIFNFLLLKTVQHTNLYLTRHLNPRQKLVFSHSNLLFQGDSGGPLMLYDESVSSWLLIGIVSFGNRFY